MVIARLAPNEFRVAARTSGGLPMAQPAARLSARGRVCKSDANRKAIEKIIVIDIDQYLVSVLFCE
jgi:hypothetical protein